MQAPIWLAGKSGAMDADTAVAALGVLKIALGWPLQLAALAAMVVAARPQPHADRRPDADGRGLEPVETPVARCQPAGGRLGASRRSSSSSTSAGTTNSSSSPASTGCSASGV